MERCLSAEVCAIVYLMMGFTLVSQRTQNQTARIQLSLHTLAIPISCPAPGKFPLGLIMGTGNAHSGCCTFPLCLILRLKGLKWVFSVLNEDPSLQTHASTNPELAQESWGKMNSVLDGWPINSTSNDIPNLWRALGKADICTCLPTLINLALCYNGEHKVNLKEGQDGCCMCRDGRLLSPSSLPQLPFCLE